MYKKREGRERDETQEKKALRYLRGSLYNNSCRCRLAVLFVVQIHIHRDSRFPRAARYHSCKEELLSIVSYLT